MYIRRADKKDMDGINRLLCQVLAVHHEGRPDLFKKDTKKYTDAQLRTLIEDEKRPIFVAVDAEEQVLGYAFCVFQQQIEDNILTDIRTLYIDDLCVDEGSRGQHVGRSLYEFVLDYAKKQHCYNITLNVWACNESALRFYEHCGLVPQKIGMETILTG
ncbi:MAG: GNAT family N-acetyltransferase [Lachnospiraceae bacterium]|nr:GNAT family N-acetyltransferase [Lachnospiraceae bacterium]